MSSSYKMLDHCIASRYLCVIGVTHQHPQHTTAMKATFVQDVKHIRKTEKVAMGMAVSSTDDHLPAKDSTLDTPQQFVTLHTVKLTTDNVLGILIIYWHCESDCFPNGTESWEWQCCGALDTVWFGSLFFAVLWLMHLDFPDARATQWDPKYHANHKPVAHCLEHAAGMLRAR